MNKKLKWLSILLVIVFSIVTLSVIVIAETDIANTNELSVVDITESDLEVTPEPVLEDELTEEIVSEIIPKSILTEELISEPILKLQSEETMDLVILKSGLMYTLISYAHDVPHIYEKPPYFIGFDKNDRWDFCIIFAEPYESYGYTIYDLPAPDLSQYMLYSNPQYKLRPSHMDYHYKHPRDIVGSSVVDSGYFGSYFEFTLGLYQAIVIHDFPVNHYLDIYEKGGNLSLCNSWGEYLTSYPEGYSSGLRIFSGYYSSYYVACIFNEEPKAGLKLSKILSAESFGKSEIFYFDIELTDADDYHIRNGEYQCIKHLADGSVEDDKTLEIIDGKVSVKLKHNESIEILGLPSDTKYRITEVNADDFVTKITVNNAEYECDIDNSNKTVSGELYDNGNTLFVDVVYTNALPFTLPDSGGNPYIPFVIGYIFLVLGFIGIYLTRKYSR